MRQCRMVQSGQMKAAGCKGQGQQHQAKAPPGGWFDEKKGSEVVVSGLQYQAKADQQLIEAAGEVCLDWADEDEEELITEAEAAVETGRMVSKQRWWLKRRKV